MVTATKLDPAAKELTLICIEEERKGFSKGRLLEKIGLKGQDTAELFFDEVRVPASNRLGEEGQGFKYLTHQLAWERLIIAIRAAQSIQTLLEETIEYTRERKVFGKPVLDFQNTRFKLAEMATAIQIGRVFVDQCMALHLEGKLDVPTAAMAKYWATDLQCKVLDECVQLHGGYGFMWEYPIARAWADARVQRIYAGTNEIMKEIIARAL